MYGDRVGVPHSSAAAAEVYNILILALVCSRGAVCVSNDRSRDYMIYFSFGAPRAGGLELPTTLMSWYKQCSPLTAVRSSPPPLHRFQNFLVDVNGLCTSTLFKVSIVETLTRLHLHKLLL